MRDYPNSDYDDIKRKIIFQKTGTIGNIYLSEDNDSYISFGLVCTDPTYSKSGLKLTYKSPVVKGSRTLDILPGGDLQWAGAFSATKSGIVTITLQATGTTELGGPTTLTHEISRSESIPDPPDIVKTEMVTNTSLYLYWSARYIGGGGKMRRFDVGYGKNSEKPTTIKTNVSPPSNVDGSYTITGLETNETYYIFVRGVNDSGVGEWSKPVGVVTSGGVYIHDNNRWRYAEPYVRTKEGWKRARAYVRKASAWSLTR